MGHNSYYHIKFGGYDQEAILKDNELNNITTRDAKSWALPV